jgi:hypothetical protein
VANYIGSSCSFPTNKTAHSELMTISHPLNVQDSIKSGRTAIPVQPLAAGAPYPDNVSDTFTATDASRWASLSARSSIAPAAEHLSPDYYAPLQYAGADRFSAGSISLAGWSPYGI